MKRDVRFTLGAIAVVLLLHRFINESVEDSNYLLLVGVGAGVLMSLAVLGLVYGFVGELALTIGGQCYSGRLFWYRVSLVSFLIGAVVAFVFNAATSLGPYKIEKWMVVYNGPITLKQLDPLASRIYRGTNEKVLTLKNGNE